MTASPTGCSAEPHDMTVMHSFLTRLLLRGTDSLLGQPVNQAGILTIATHYWFSYY